MIKAKRKKKIIWNRLIISIVSLYAILIVANQRFTIYKLNKVKEEISKEIEISEIENEKLKDMLENASNKECLEKMAREQLGLVKPDEIVYVDHSSSDVYLQEGGN